MIYEFLYKSKPVNTYHITITFFWILIFLGFSVYNYCLSRPPKEKYQISKTLQYNANLQKEVVISQTISENTNNSYEKKFYMKRITISALFCIIFSTIFAFELYDYATAPNENTKITDIYRISKKRNYLTFTLTKPYNHLYKTKTMEITYKNPNEYVIIANQQTYKIPKKSVNE